MNKTTQSAFCILHSAFCITFAALPALAQDYIDVPRGSFIDTGFKPDSNTRVVMDVTVQNAFEYWFGAWDGNWNDRAFAAGNDFVNVYTGYGSGNQCGGSGARVANGRHTLDYSNGVFRVDGNVHTTRTGTFEKLKNNLYLFAQNRALSNAFDMSEVLAAITHSSINAINSIIPPMITKPDTSSLLPAAITRLGMMAINKNNTFLMIYYLCLTSQI